MVKVLTPKKKLDGINKPLEIRETDEGKLIEQLRGNRSFRIFADWLNAGIPDDTPGRTTYSSAYNWETGIYKISPFTLWAWKKFYPKSDLRHQCALKIEALRREKAEADIDGKLSFANGEKIMQAVQEKVNGKQHKVKAEG